MVSGGCSFQWIQPPKPSLRGTRSERTRVRLAAVEPRPRREMPSVVGLATQLDERRKSWKPACCWRRSSRVRAGYWVRAVWSRVSVVVVFSADAGGGAGGGHGGSLLEE